ncbi:MAG: MBL fold metallo-hydrolase [Candidatus Latescibacteria bacterium]|jgi:phosphoribosyl 1,2-cyclic phosphodiesterase|nr:MBL fold metallo-hydrolase [Candidatus Latescibacterota bacterium]HJP32576.1 MBL fold metallo-hydrolase [Candidatus Latescibacterota bacterium]
MQIRFWGVRGSFPVSSPDAIRYGGNTPCLEVETATGVIVIDAGTGIRELGKSLLERSATHVDLLLSHAHWDHIQGFPHFAPLYRADFTLTVHALRHPGHSLSSILAGQQQEPFFPVGLDDLKARIEFVEHEDGDRFEIAGARILCRRLNHPGVTGGFRIESDGRTVSYICDTDLNSEHLLASELPARTDADRADWLLRLRQAACDLGHSADLVVCDTFFLPDDDSTWGHSRPDDFLEFAAQGGVSRICLFHHRPGRSDDELDAIVDGCRHRVAGGVQVLGAREGMEIDLE